MHRSAIEHMTAMVEEYAPASGDCLDVGALDVNGSYRLLIEAQGLAYVGVDIRAGRNVDIVMDDPRKLPFSDHTFSVVISGSCIEHAEDPWTLVREMVRVAKPGAHVILHAPFAWHVHGHPSDYWRFTDEGLKLLLEQAGATVVCSYMPAPIGRAGWKQDAIAVGLVSR